jgi:2'-5' RNA ligase
MRLFIGAPILETLAHELSRTARRIETAGARWTPPQSMHLTLVFLGEVAEQRIPIIVTTLSDLDTTPFAVKIAGLGAFERACVLFAEVEPIPRLLRLQAQVAERMAACGFTLEPRPYHPHITLARSRSPIKLRREVMLPSQFKNSFRLEAVNLYHSRPTASGSVYEVLAQLGAPIRQTAS